MSAESCRDSCERVPVIAVVSSLLRLDTLLPFDDARLTVEASDAVVVIFADGAAGEVSVHGLRLAVR